MTRVIRGAPRRRALIDAAQDLDKATGGDEERQSHTERHGAMGPQSGERSCAAGNWLSFVIPDPSTPIE
jgi:hypothetical protein